MTTSCIAEALDTVEATGDEHDAAGRALFEACSGSLYPMDGLAMATLDRSLALMKGFVLLIKNGGYIPAAALVRMQLDSVIRLNGVMSQSDPHGIAQRVISGERLDRIVGDGGKRMHDAALRALLSGANQWVDHVYAVASGYVHLSGQHVLHFLQRSVVNEHGTRNLGIGDGDDYLRDDQRIDLVNAFAGVTRGTLTVTNRWTERRGRYSGQAELAARFQHRL